MKTKFLKPNDPLLNKVSKKVPIGSTNSPEFKKIVGKMLKTIAGERREKRKGVGLAAPQIGILKRIILVDVGANGKKPTGKEVTDLRIYLNPEIVWQSKRETDWYEGCFSTGNVCGIVSRPTSIKIRAFVITWESFRLPSARSADPRRYDIAKTLGANRNPPPRWKLTTEKWSGYVARIFQHEIDHLDGKVFVDRIKDPEKLHLVKEGEFLLYRKSWKTWHKKCSFEKWNKIKKPLLKAS